MLKMARSQEILHIGTNLQNWAPTYNPDWLVLTAQGRDLAPILGDLTQI